MADDRTPFKGIIYNKKCFSSNKTLQYLSSFCLWDSVTLNTFITAHSDRSFIAYWIYKSNSIKLVQVVFGSINIMDSLNPHNNHLRFRRSNPASVLVVEQWNSSLLSGNFWSSHEVWQSSLHVSGILLQYCVPQCCYEPSGHITKIMSPSSLPHKVKHAFWYLVLVLVFTRVSLGPRSYLWYSGHC